MNVPSGWKVSQDTGGKCLVATPAGWQLGHDFFLGVESVSPAPSKAVSGDLPPTGSALWETKEGSRMPAGKRYQIRKSLVTNGKVYSVWRIKEASDFTDAEVRELEEVGKTLRAVQ